MTYRDSLERAIIGQISQFETGYQVIGDIISEHNFESKIEGFPCEKIFLAVKSLYPDNPIDLLTVSKRCLEMNPKESYGNIAYAILEASKNIHQISNLRYHALQLVQLCIENQLITIIGDMQGNEILNEAKRQIYHSTKLGYDILEVVANAQIHLEELGFKNEALLIKKLNDNIVSKAISIKRASQIQCLIKNIESIFELVPAKKDELKNKSSEMLKIIYGIS